MCRELLAFFTSANSKSRELKLHALREGMRELSDRGLLASLPRRATLHPIFGGLKLAGGELQFVILNPAMNARDAITEERHAEDDGIAVTARRAHTPSIMPTMECEHSYEAGASRQVLLDQLAALTSEMIKQRVEDTGVASAAAALGALAEQRRVDIGFSDVMMSGRMNGVSQPMKIIHKRYRMEQLRDALPAVTRNARNPARVP